MPAADERAVALVLVKLAQLAADVPEVRELDINPLLADKDGVIAVDARVAVAPAGKERRRAVGHPRFAVRPYPKEWERDLVLRDGREVFVRPVRPEDEEMFLALLQAGDAGGPAPALLRAGARFQPRLPRAPDAARLRPRHRLRRHRSTRAAR